MAEYDPKVLHQYADRLYSKASVVAIRYGTVGFLVGLALAAVPAGLIANYESEARIKRFSGTGNGFNVPVQESTRSNLPTVIVVAGIVVGTVSGAAVGRRKSFQYRLQAQLTLCQMQIERNTSKGE